MVFGAEHFDNHEEVVFARDLQSGLKAIIAVHDTGLGPALGGCRMCSYPSESHALDDVLRLSRAMSYKAAFAGVPLGGGKSVILGNPHTDKSAQLMLAMGRAVAKLGGRFIIGEDIGTGPSDMAVIKTETNYVCCLEKADGGYGDPAAMTALGVFNAMRAARIMTSGSDDMRGVRVAVQGVGNVGHRLCGLLARSRAELIVADVQAAAVRGIVERLNATAVSPEQIYSVDADVFAPCATGSSITAANARDLRCAIIAGAANNQLDDPQVERQLLSQQILYVPDYVANAGGLIACAAEWYRTDAGAIEASVEQIFGRSLQLLRRAVAKGEAPSTVANSIAETRLRRARRRRD